MDTKGKHGKEREPTGNGSGEEARHGARHEGSKRQLGGDVSPVRHESRQHGHHRPKRAQVRESAQRIRCYRYAAILHIKIHNIS